MKIQPSRLLVTAYKNTSPEKHLLKSGGKHLDAYIVSLGCPKNFVDTEIIAASLLLAGIGMTSSSEDAQIYLINTCAFIPPARKEAESYISKAVRWKSKAPSRRRIVVCGCLIQKEKPETLTRNFPDVDFWTGIDGIEDVGKQIAGGFPSLPQKKCHKVDKPRYLYNDMTPRLQLTPPHYAYLKISDGCSNRCSYCSIPSIRGEMRCRELSSVVREAENLIGNGCREIILTAQDSTLFSSDGKGIVELLEKLDSLEGDFWIRMMYAHPAHFHERLIGVFAGAEHLLPYIDLPLQHISDSILRSMGRKIDSASTRRLLDEIRSSIPGIAIRTTFLVGYPGETDEDFLVLRDFVKEQRFARMGVFRYYPEQATPAATLPGAVDLETAKERERELMELQSGISLDSNMRLMGEKLRIIIDKAAGGKAKGRSYMDAPDIDNVVLLDKCRSVAAGEFVDVEITSADTYSISAIPY